MSEHNGSESAEPPKFSVGIKRFWWVFAIGIIFVGPIITLIQQIPPGALLVGTVITAIVVVRKRNRRKAKPVAKGKKPLTDMVRVP